MKALWILVGALCGLLSLFLRTLGKDYGDLLTGVLSWALFAFIIILATRRYKNWFQFIGGTAIVGALLMTLGMLPLDLVLFFPGGDEVSKTIGFDYLSRAVGGAIAGLALYYLWKLSEKVWPKASSTENGT